MAIPRVSLSGSPALSSYKSKQKKALETKRKLLRKKQTTGLKNQTKNVVSDNHSKAIVSYEAKKTLATDSHNCARAKSSAMERAEEVKSKLPPDFPSFVKPMLPSHVTGGFWLSFPKRFCDLHLPKHDDTVVLVDEVDREYETKYLIDKNGLSGGWRGFSIAHKLLEGDVLIFQLIGPCKFKVYVVRVNGLTEIDGAIGLLNLDVCAKPKDSKNEMKICGMEGGKLLERLSLDIHSETNCVPGADHSGCGSDDFALEVLEGIRFSQSAVNFSDMKGIEGFEIHFDGLIIDSEIPPNLRVKYYDLCCNQNSFLHDHLLPGLNCKLAAGIISETVNIADAIRACRRSTSREILKTWVETLEAFEKLGMKVGFLSARLEKLVSLSSDSQEIMRSKQLEQAKGKEEIRSMELKLFEAKEVIKNLDAEIEALKVKGEDRVEFMFHEVANAPW